MKTLQTYKKYLFIILPIAFVIFAKLGTNPSINLWAILLPIVAAVVGLTLLSPPVAAALVFMSHNLIGQITMAHPGLFVQIFPALALIASLIYVRRNEIQMRGINWRVKRPEAWGLIAIVAILIFGFFHGVFAQTDMFSGQVVANLFKASHGGSSVYYPYVFLSRWSIFILIGALCCRGANELKIFFLALAIFVTTQLVAIPLGIYEWVLSDMCLNQINYTGLQALNINRAYLGYLLACASFTTLTFAVHEVRRVPAIFYYSGSLVLLFLCVIAGSKGPVLAVAIAFLFLLIRGGKKLMPKILGFGLVFIILSVTLPKLYGCVGGLHNIMKSSVATAESSVSVRADLAQAEYKKTEDRNLLRGLFGGGLGASLSTIESTFINPHDNKPITIKSSSGSHNLFIDFYVDLGVVGLCIFVIGVLVLVVCFFKEVKHSSEGQLLTNLMGGVLLILLVYSVLATAPSMATIQALFLGLLFGVGINKNQQSGEGR